MKIQTQMLRLNVSYGLFRQNLNGTGTRNLTKTNGFLDIMLSFRTATGAGTGRDQELREWVSNPFWNLHSDHNREFMVSCTANLYVC